MSPKLEIQGVERGVGSLLRPGQVEGELALHHEASGFGSGQNLSRARQCGEQVERAGFIRANPWNNRLGGFGNEKLTGVANPTAYEGSGDDAGYDIELSPVVAGGCRRIVICQIQVVRVR